jgi:hypothetical protein
MKNGNEPVPSEDSSLETKILFKKCPPSQGTPISSGMEGCSGGGYVEAVVESD